VTLLLEHGSDSFQNNVWKRIFESFVDTGSIEAILKIIESYDNIEVVGEAAMTLSVFLKYATSGEMKHSVLVKRTTEDAGNLFNSLLRSLSSSAAVQNLEASSKICILLSALVKEVPALYNSLKTAKFRKTILNLLRKEIKGTGNSSHTRAQVESSYRRLERMCALLPAVKDNFDYASQLEAYDSFQELMVAGMDYEGFMAHWEELNKYTALMDGCIEVRSPIHMHIHGVWYAC
jgi:hypothetical protein